jgi:hypothetical protein
MDDQLSDGMVVEAPYISLGSDGLLAQGLDHANKQHFEEFPGRKVRVHVPKPAAVGGWDDDPKPSTKSSKDSLWPSHP